MNLLEACWNTNPELYHHSLETIFIFANIFPGSNLFTPTFSRVFLPGLQVSVVGLERALNAYVKEAPDAPFDIKTVPLATASMQEQMAKPGKPSIGTCRNECAAFSVVSSSMTNSTLFCFSENGGSCQPTNCSYIQTRSLCRYGIVQCVEFTGVIF